MHEGPYVKRRTCTVKDATCVWVVADVSEYSSERGSTVVQYLRVQFHEGLCTEHELKEHPKTSRTGWRTSVFPLAYSSNRL